MLSFKQLLQQLVVTRHVLMPSAGHYYERGICSGHIGWVTLEAIGQVFQSIALMDRLLLLRCLICSTASGSMSLRVMPKLTKVSLVLQRCNLRL